MGLLDSSVEEPKSKMRRYVVTGVAFVLLLALGLWWTLRFYPERQAAAHFLDALAAGDTARAYVLWKPGPSYTMKDFLDDWGAGGYWGPVKSYQIESVFAPRRGGSGVIVKVQVCPIAPFPDAREAANNRRIKEVRIWVETADKSLSFPP